MILANVKHVCDVQIKPDSVTMSSKCDSAVQNYKTLHLDFFITLPNARSSLSHVNVRGNSTNTVTVTPTGNCPLVGDNLMNAQQYYYC